MVQLALYSQPELLLLFGLCLFVYVKNRIVHKLQTWDYEEQLYVHKFDNIDQMDKFTERPGKGIAIPIYFILQWVLCKKLN